MKYYFHKFEQLVHSIVVDADLPQLGDTAEIEKNIEVFIQEKDRVRIHIIQDAFEMPEQKMLELLIDKQQCVLTRLLNRIYTHTKKTKKPPPDYKRLCEALYDQLNELLVFIHTHYFQFFNHQSNLPMLEMEQLNKQIRPRLEKIATNLKMAVIPEKLIAIIVSTIDVLLSNEGCNYKQYAYLKSFIGELEVFDYSTDPDILQDNFKNMLIAVNFNNAEMTKYLIKEWQSDFNKEDSVQEKLRILKYRLKEIRQLTEKPEWFLNSIEASLKQQLLTWLNEEIEYYQSEQASVTPAQGQNENEPKIHTSMSVPQLALLFRLLKEDDQITNANQSEFLKVVSGSFTTLKKENFSYGHLHGKYYKIEAHTRRVVYDMLMRMLHLSRKIGAD